MNDFTKEELKLILDGLSYALSASKETGGMMVDILTPISKKVQNMIINYCEHNYIKSLDKSGMYFISACIICKDTKPWSEND